MPSATISSSALRLAARSCRGASRKLLSPKTHSCRRIAALAERLLERRVGPGDVAVERHRDIQLQLCHRSAPRGRCRALRRTASRNSSALARPRSMAHAQHCERPAGTPTRRRTREETDDVRPPHPRPRPSRSSSANASGKTPVVFIHGLWLLPSSWDRWAAVFEEAGYTALTPGWPDDPETVEEANAHPEVFAHKTVGQVADHFAEVIGQLEKKPAVIGHSFGGLLDADRRRARPLGGVGRDRPRAVPRRAAAADLGAARRPRRCSATRRNWNRAVPLTYEQFRYGFANAVSEDEAKELYETFAVPAPGAPLFQAAAANLNPWTEAKVDTQEPRARPAADHLRREGPHRAVGDRQGLVQEAEAQRGRDRDRRDSRTAATRSRSTTAGARSPTPPSRSCSAS